MYEELLLIPVLTTILTTIVLYVKENQQGKKELKRSINEQKLKELYNDLFSLSLIYTDKLEQSFFITPKGMFEHNGELLPKEDTEMINDIEVWDELIIKIRDLIHGKLHLLEEEDLSQWHQIELTILNERFDNKINIKKYRQLEMFLVNMTIRYKELYKKYHVS
ncbi:hypothetical protein LIT38_20430 [Bacillus sp. CMF12]|uniref:hypothetical protein n=1 Tax=Bacillus sp. CMF12 TaxID=2884834 RepID=UPI002079FC7A|nr:hypothetical protein [Bacillus sp. CMF12]USK48879.1 hypothetical protein LIT38_20430 [Bacillus sp. CMF12]